jgi:hypothetical protein
VSVDPVGGLRQDVVAEIFEAGYGAVVLASYEESQGIRESGLIDSTLDDKTTMLFQNFGHQSPSDAASYSTRTETSTTLLLVSDFA